DCRSAISAPRMDFAIVQPNLSQYFELLKEGGVSIAFRPAVSYCRYSLVAGRGYAFVFRTFNGAPSDRSCAIKLRRRIRRRGSVLAPHTLERRTFTRPICLGEAARRRAFADRARWKRRGQIGRAAGRPALFLVRGGCVASNWSVACTA